jgi:tetratricopeptide (TPR) repeat protein
VSFEAHKSLGRLYTLQNQIEKALQEFFLAIEMEPENPFAYFEVGKIYWVLNENTKSTLYFDKYIQLGGNKDKVKEIKGGACRNYSP